MSGFERRKEQKKESIRRAALELFELYGFKKVSVNDIAHKAGVSPVTIYNHFGSKDELVREVVKTQFLNIVKIFRDIVDGDSPFPQKLEAIIFDKTQIVSQFQGELAQTLFQTDPEMQQFVETLWRSDIIQLTLDLLEEGKREGYVNQEVSMEALLQYLQILRSGVLANPDLIAQMALNQTLYAS